MSMFSLREAFPEKKTPFLLGIRNQWLLHQWYYPAQMHCKYYHHQWNYQYSLLLLIELSMFSVNFRSFQVVYLFSFQGLICLWMHIQRYFQNNKLCWIVSEISISINWAIAGLFVSLEVVTQRVFAYNIASTQICFLFRENNFCDWLLPSKVSQPLKGLVCRSARKHPCCF